MADALYLSKLNVNGTEYSIKDANAATAADLASKVGYGEYDSTNQLIKFYDKQSQGSLLFSIDATDFIKDGMVSDVAISNGNLVITFNTDAGHNAISIPLTDIFNPANYYDKTAMDAALALKADASNVYTKSEADGKFLTEHQSLANYPTIETMNTALGQKANVSDIYTQTEIDNKLAAKANSADLATVATTGSYDDLTDKPVIPEGVIVDAALSDTSENAVQNKVVKGALDAKQDALHYYNENTENESATIHIENTENGTNGDLGVDGLGVIMSASVSEQDEGSTVARNAGISANGLVASMFYEQSVDDEPTTHSTLEVGVNNIGLSVESDVDPMPYSHLNVNNGNISLEVMSDEDHTTTFAVDDAGVTINDERVLTESDGVYYIDFGVLTTQGIHDADWDGLVAAIGAHRPIYAGLGSRYYTAECLSQEEANKIIMTASDEQTHYFYTFTKNGSEDYSFSYETRPYTTTQEKAAWNAKQDAISDLATIRSGAALGATAYQKPSTGIPASDIADGVIPTVPTNVSAFTNDAGYLTEHQSLADYYTKTQVDTALGSKANSADLATVATSGSYNDLTDKPTIPTQTQVSVTGETLYITTE